MEQSYLVGKGDPRTSSHWRHLVATTGYVNLGIETGAIAGREEKSSPQDSFADRVGPAPEDEIGQRPTVELAEEMQASGTPTPTG